VYYTDSGNRAMALGLGLDPRSHPTLEHGSQQHRGQAYDQGRGDRSEPPPSSAGSKCKHRRKNATAWSRGGCWVASGRDATMADGTVWERLWSANTGHWHYRNACLEADIAGLR
jgi:hypothetical protein